MEVPRVGDALLISCTMAMVHLIVERTSLRWSHPITLKLGLGYALFSAVWAALSFAMLFRLGLVADLPHSLLGSRATRFELPQYPALTIIYSGYFFSKMWELQDLVFASLRGFPLQALGHFRIHHYTTLPLAWCIWRGRSAAGLLFIVMNTFMHIWVYLYHSGNPTRLVFVVTRAMQPVQLFVGIVASLACAGARILLPPQPLHHGLWVEGFWTRLDAEDRSFVYCQLVVATLCLVYATLFVFDDLRKLQTGYWEYPPQHKPEHREGRRKKFD